MSVYKKKGSDNYTIDLTLRGVGRLTPSSESPRKVDARSREALLRKLRRAGQLDVLKALKAKRITMGQLVQAERAKRLDDDNLLADASLDAPLVETFAALFTKLAKKKPKTARRYLTSLRWLSSRFTSRTLVRGLDWIDYDDLRAEHTDQGRSAADWNHLRRMISRGLTLHLGDPHHRFRRDVLAKIDVAREPPGRQHTLSLTAFRDIVSRVPAPLMAAYWTLLATGMRCITEYLRTEPKHLRPDIQAVEVPGTKTEGAAQLIVVAQELWPYVVAGVPSPVGHATLTKYWHRAAVAAGLGRYDPTGRTIRVRRPGRPGYPTNPSREPQYDNVLQVRYTGPRLHDIRHLSIALALEGGAALHEARAHGRHATASQTLDYARLNHSRQAARAIWRAVDTLSGGRTDGRQGTRD